MGDLFLHHDERTGPKHRGEKARQNARDKAKHNVCGQADHKITNRSTDHTRHKDTHDVLTVFRIGDSAKAEKNGKCRHAEDITKRFIHVQRIFHKAGHPVRHRVFRAAAKENAKDAERKSHRSALCTGNPFHGRSGIHLRHGRDHEQHRRDNGKKRPEHRKIHPIFMAEHTKEERADNNNEKYAKGIERMERTHISFGMLRGDRRDDRAEKHLGKSCGNGENNCADRKPRISVFGEERRCERIDEKSRRRDERHHLDDLMDIKMLRKNGKNKVDRKLCAEIDKHERAEQCVRDAVRFMEHDKKKRRQAENGRHREIRRKASEFRSAESIRFHKKDPFKNVLFTGRNRAAPANKSPHRQGKQVHALRRE